MANAICEGVYGRPKPPRYAMVPESVEIFLSSIDGLNEEQARTKFRADRGYLKWNAETQRAILLGIRALYAMPSAKPTSTRRKGGRRKRGGR